MNYESREKLGMAYKASYALIVNENKLNLIGLYYF